jgi:hypothetical protein
VLLRHAGMLGGTCIAFDNAAAAAAAAGLQESLFSAGVWRSGLVGLLWYAGAFPLLFWQHCLVQVRSWLKWNLCVVS